jgi:protein CpxP
LHSELTLKNMKINTLMMALLAGALIAPELVAQQNPNRPQQPRPGQARDRIGRIAEQLKLTEKQRKQWAKVTAEQQQKQRALFQNRDVPREKLRERFEALRKETQELQQKILTKEQQAKYKELVQRRPQPRQGPGGGRPDEGRRPGGGFGGRDQFGQLDLTEKQQEKMKAIQQAQTAEMQKMFQQLQGGGGDREGLRAKFAAFREKYDKQIQAVLTDDQKKKYAELRAQRGQGGNRPGGFRGRNPFAQLDIKEEQQKKLDAARQAMSTGMRGLFQDRDTPREERNAKMQKLREAYEAKVKGILTPEQYKKYQEARPQQRPGRGDRGRPGERPRPRRDDI